MNEKMLNSLSLWIMWIWVGLDKLNLQLTYFLKFLFLSLNQKKKNFDFIAVIYIFWYLWNSINFIIRKGQNFFILQILIFEND